MVKVNMMCGKRNFGDDWVHIDKEKGKIWTGPEPADFLNIKSNDIYLEQQFDNSIDLIYCSHGIAYFSKLSVPSLLSTWFKKLRSGATLRIATPDWEVLREFKQPLIGPIYGEMYTGGNNNPIYHKMIYTFESLHKLLTECGFINIHRYDHTKTEHPNTGNREDKYDDCSAAYYEGKLISLNVQCYKP